MMDISDNDNIGMIPESKFKIIVGTMMVRINMLMGNAHSESELTFVASEIWRNIYFLNKSVPFGILRSYYNDVKIGKVTLKKITVQSILPSIQSYIDDFKERIRVNNARLINEKERKQTYSGLLSAKSPIGAAACWMITKRCDGVNVDYLSTKQVAECIEKGINPDFLIKQENAR